MEIPDVQFDITKIDDYLNKLQENAWRLLGPPYEKETLIRNCGGEYDWGKVGSSLPVGDLMEKILFDA